jgi:hypothetical protein
VFFVFQRQAAEAATRAHETDLQRIQFDRQMTEARLQSLRAQIEPHFLFNTLANVQQLYRTQPERGRRMLGNFVAYLRAALPQMRHDETTLEREVDLARAYLDVLQVRMGKRLKVNFDIPKDLTVLAFPPFALSTLTENAIKHGLNPLPEGGAIEIATAAPAPGSRTCGRGLPRCTGTRETWRSRRTYRVEFVPQLWCPSGTQESGAIEWLSRRQCQPCPGRTSRRRRNSG